MKTVSIIGFGRFGKTLYRLIKDDFEVTLFSRSPITKTGDMTPATRIAASLAQAYESEVVFFCVPISSFEGVIKTHKEYFRPEHLLIDVLSVKMHPEKVFTKHLKGTKTRALLTHPMFGPDSSRKSFIGLPMIMDRFLATAEEYAFWKQYFADKKLRIIEISAREHDKLAANSQGLTHFIGRLLESYNMKPTTIDSLGAEKLQEVIDQTCNDTLQLFADLQHYNPYTKHMRIRLGEKFQTIYNKLLPKRVQKGFITYGIQGGRGSFNEEALMHYVHEENIKKYKIKYLYTSDNVMRALHAGEIDIGQVAIQNAVGGLVEESIHAMAPCMFTITAEFAIPVSHTLMIRTDATFSDIDTIMSHPQAFAQCKQTLAEKYPNLTQISGEGELIDHAKVARYLGEKKLPKNVATLGSSILATLYHLTIVEKNLQDAKENLTTFLHVRRV